MIPILL